MVFGINVVAVVVSIVVVAVVLTVLNLRVVVPTNEVHIVQKANKTLAYGKEANNGKGNSYYRFPSWIPFIGVSVTSLDSSVFDIDLKDYEAYDKDRLPFLVDIKAFFRISDFDITSSRINSFDELRSQLLGIVQGAARSILAKEDLENIMSERNIYGQKFTDEIAEQLASWGVSPVKNIELMDIRDSHSSEVIANIMKKKKSQIEKESRETVALNMQKAKEAEIVALQEVNLKEQEANRQVGLRKAAVQQEVGIATEKAEQEVKEQKKLTAEKEMQVLKVQKVRTAEIEKESAIINAEQEKNVISINAEANVTKTEAEKKVKILQAEANKTQMELNAEANLVQATKGAEGIKAQGLAKGEAERQMQLANVAGQVELATKIGENKDYQDFIVRQKQVEALCEVGKEQAKALTAADIKIYATGTNATDGLNQATQTLSPKTALDLGSLVNTFAETPIGEKLVSKFLDNKISSKINVESLD